MLIMYSKRLRFKGKFSGHSIMFFAATPCNRVQSIWELFKKIIKVNKNGNEKKYG